MRVSKFKQKLQSGEIVRICVLGHYIPSFIQLAAHYEFDAIWVDCEHRDFSTHQIQSLMPLFHQSDIDCMLRPPTLEKTKLCRYLEDGVTGFLIPHVSTPAKAQMLVQSTKFPPIGDRGIDGAGYDSTFSIQGGEDYTDEANRETFLVVQIETLEGVENVESIASTKGVDALFIGPGDLGLRLKKSKSTLSLNDCRIRIAKACEKYGIAWGGPATSFEIMNKYVSEGAQLISYGNDFLANKSMLQSSKKCFDQAIGLK